MKRVLVISGNIASGKSTISQAVAKAMPGSVVVNLDSCRVDVFTKGLGNGPIHRDLLAQEQCIRQMKGSKLIYETTAVTKFYKRAAAHLRQQGYEFITVHLQCSASTCLTRYTTRKGAGHIQAPFAYGQQKADIQEAIAYFADEQTRIRADLTFNTEQLPVDQIVASILEHVNRN